MDTKSNLPDIKLTGLLKKHNDVETIKKEVHDRVIHIPNLEVLRGTIQIISLVCEYIEAFTEPDNKKKAQLNKKQMALDVLKQIYDTNSLEEQTADKNIEYLIDSKAIKRKSKLRRVGFRLKHFFLNK